MTASAQVRARAAKIVAGVAMHGRSLDDLLSEDQVRNGHATPQQKGLLRALCYDSIRWYVRLDALLQRLLARPGQSLEPDVRALAIVGLCQLLYTNIPPHAAVDETVNAARLIGQPRAGGLINAILRRCQREHAAHAQRIDGDRALRTAHPRWLVDALAADWAAQCDAILNANNQRPPFWVRVNRRQGTGHEYRSRLHAAGLAVSASGFDDEALLLEQAVDVGDLPGFTDGAVSVQDAAAQLAARFLAPLAGERVLDACAAPGGKTGHLLELAPELAALVAVDVSRERMTRVEENLQRLQRGSRARPNVQLLVADAADTAAWWDGQRFDRILLDVPCSATGVIRRHPDIKLLRREEDVVALAARQTQLLRSLWHVLSAGGRLVYASCSALRAETSEVVERFLADAADARDVTRPIVALSGIEVPALDPDATRAGYRIAAGTAGMDGFYYACLEKK